MSRRNGGIIGPTNTPVGGLTTGVAGGVWRMNDVLTFVSNNQWPKGPENIENSCRFDDGSSDYLTKTFSSAGNRKTWTWSGWVKRCTLGAQQDLLSVSSGSSAYHLWYIDSNDGVTHNYNGTYVSSAPKFRDVSAWYHFVCAVDTTQSTAADRVKMYVNGSQITSFDAAGYPSQDADLSINNNVRHDISNGGAHFSNNFYLDGYMAEVVFIDGQQLTPSSFGETDSTTGIWKPKKIGLFTSAGDNSFYLDFKDSSTLGNDASGLNNDFTVNNLTSIDQSTDTCVENFATLNSLDNYYFGGTFSEGNLKVLSVSSVESYITGTIGLSTGKWYWEIKITSSGSGRDFVGIVDKVAETSSFSAYSGNSNAISYYGYTGDSKAGSTTTNSSWGATFGTGDTIGVAMDLDNNKIYFSKNGTFQNSGDPTSGSTGTGALAIPTSPVSGFYFPQFANIHNTASTYEANFGNPPHTISSGNSDANGFGNFEYAVPSGYYALNTSNLNTYG